MPRVRWAVVTGAVMMPILVGGMTFLSGAFHNDAVLMAWSLVAFVLPVVLSTSDPSYLRRNLFRPTAAAVHFRDFYVPAWGRVAAYVIAGTLSTLLCGALGLLSLDFQNR
jgi:hypothetical protein